MFLLSQKRARLSSFSSFFPKVRAYGGHPRAPGKRLRPLHSRFLSGSQFEASVLAQMYLTQYPSICYNLHRSTILSYYDVAYIYVLYDNLATYDEWMCTKAKGDCSQRREGMTIGVSLFDLLLPR